MGIFFCLPPYISNYLVIFQNKTSSPKDYEFLNIFFISEMLRGVWFVYSVLSYFLTLKFKGLGIC